MKYTSYGLRGNKLQPSTHTLHAPSCWTFWGGARCDHWLQWCTLSWTWPSSVVKKITLVLVIYIFIHINTCVSKLFNFGFWAHQRRNWRIKLAYTGTAENARTQWLHSRPCPLSCLSFPRLPSPGEPVGKWAKLISHSWREYFNFTPVFNLFSSLHLARSPQPIITYFSTYRSTSL